MEQNKPEKIVAAELPAAHRMVVGRSRVSWWMVIPHTISIYWQLKMVGLRIAIIEWLGVDRLIQQERTARERNDATNTELINRVAKQGNNIANILPALVNAKKRQEFYESTGEYLYHAKGRFDRANRKNKLTLEKINDRENAQRNGSGAGTGGEVSESPRPDAEGETGQGEVRGETSDGAQIGRDGVQEVAATRQQIIGEVMDSDEAAAGTTQRTVVKCDLCEMTSERAQPREPCICGGGTYRLLLRVTRKPT